jgi:hypothetical protein
MSENKNGGEGEGAPNTKNASSNQNGTVPPKTDAGQTKTFDPSSVSDDEFGKVFEDERLWKHDRFKQLIDKAKKADKFEADEQKKKEDQLLEEKKYQELITEKDKKLGELTNQLQESKVNSQIQSEAQKAGIQDLDAAIKLIDRTAIKVEDDGTITGVAEAVNKLVESRPYLKTGTAQPSVGSGTNPATGNQQIPRFKHSQLLDPVFYREHEKEIEQAMKLGLIENDISQ